MEEQKRSKKKSKHTGAKVTAGVVILAALLAGGYGLGFGRGSGQAAGAVPGTAATASESKQAETQVIESEPEKTQEEAAAVVENDGVLTISVQEEKLTYEGKEVTITELEEQILKDFREGITVELKDNHAIKAAYDEVTALLQKLNIPFTTGN